MNAPSSPGSTAENETSNQALHLTMFLKKMAEEKASDMFITVGAPLVIKKDGKLHALSRALSSEDARALVISVMDPKQRGEFEKTHEANFAIGLTGVGRFRVSAFYQRGQVGMVVRRIETTIPKLEELDLPPVLKEISLTKRGIVLMVGATGTGKSTTLAAMVGYRNRHTSGHIITIEDPIEFVHAHHGCVVTQREIGVDTDSWETALKNTLRQAPDVILIGEIRTRESMDHAIAFAETGHLVLATLHANNANQTLDRILNFFPEDRRNQLLMDLSLNLKAVCAQQLIPKKSGGRKAILEIMLNTPLVEEKIRRGEVSVLKSIMKDSELQGMKTFDGALIEAYFKNEIEYEDAIRYADSQNEVRLAVKLSTAGGKGALGGGLNGVELDEK